MAGVTSHRSDPGHFSLVTAARAGDACSIQILEPDVLEPAVLAVVLEAEVAGPVEVLDGHLAELVLRAIGARAGLGPLVEAVGLDVGPRHGVALARDPARAARPIEDRPEVGVGPQGEDSAADARQDHPDEARCCRDPHGCLLGSFSCRWPGRGTTAGDLD